MMGSRGATLLADTSMQYKPHMECWESCPNVKSYHQYEYTVIYHRLFAVKNRSQYEVHHYSLSEASFSF
jgi:hypothetical protein